MKNATYLAVVVAQDLDLSWGKRRRSVSPPFSFFSPPSTCPRLWGVWVLVSLLVQNRRFFCQRLGARGGRSSPALSSAPTPRRRSASSSLVAMMGYLSHQRRGEKPPSLLVASGWGFSPLDDPSFGRLGGGPTVVSSSQGCSLRDVEGPSHAVMYSYNSD